MQQAHMHVNKVMHDTTRATTSNKQPNIQTHTRTKGHTRVQANSHTTAANTLSYGSNPHATNTNLDVPKSPMFSATLSFLPDNVNDEEFVSRFGLPQKLSKRERNRLAVKKYRNRKRGVIKHLLKRIRALEIENQQLREQLLPITPFYSANSTRNITIDTPTVTPLLSDSLSNLIGMDALPPVTTTAFPMNNKNNN